MKVLFLDTFGDALDLALRAQKVGHDVVYFVDSANERYQFIGKGLTKLVRNFRPWLRWADLVVLCDNTKFLREIDVYRRENPQAVVFGPTQAVAEWEQDRSIGQEVLIEHDIPIISFQEFKDYDAAIAYVKRRDTRLVSKPFGDADKSLSYCAKSPEDLVFMLKKWKKERKLKGSFIIQDFIEGVEFGVGVYVGPSGFISPWESNWEFKKLMPNDVGQSTGETGTVLAYTDKSKLAEQMLQPFENTLISLGYSGCVDINCIIDKQGRPWPLEWTMRLGFPATQLQTRLMPNDPIEWIARGVITGEKAKFKTDTVCVGVAVCLPPYPYPSAPLNLVLDFPIYGMNGKNANALHAYQVQKGDDTPWKSAGDYLLVVTGVAPTVSGAAKKAYVTIKELIIPGSPLYRCDIGAKLQKCLPEIQKHGYALEFTY